MKPRGSRRGMALLGALVLCMLVVVVINALAIGAGQAIVRQRLQMRREAALCEARGGIRWGAAGSVSPLIRRDERGELRVTLNGERIESVFVPEGPGLRVRVVAKIHRNADGSVSCGDWMEE